MTKGFTRFITLILANMLKSLCGVKAFCVIFVVKIKVQGMKNVALITICTCVVIVSKAQTKGVIADLQTGVGIAGAKIHTNVGRDVVTGSRGEFVISFPFSSATVSKGLYISRNLSVNELRDTVLLLARDISLHEVVVYGKKPQISPYVFKGIKDTGFKSAVPKGAVGNFSFFDMFNFLKKGHVSSRERERRRKAIENY